MKDGTEELYPHYYMEKILTFLFPLAFVLCLLLIIRDLEIDFVQDNINIYATMILSFIIQIFTTISLRLFTHKKTKLSVHIRALLLIIIYNLILCYFLGLMNEPYMIIPSCIIQYYLTAQIQTLWVDYFALCDQCMDKSGKELVSELFHYNDNATRLEHQIQKTQAVCVVSALGLLLILTLSGYSGRILSASAFFLTVLYSVCLIFLLIIFEIYKKHIYFSFLGFNTVLDHKPLILKNAAPIILVITLFCIFLTPGKTLIKIHKPEITPLPKTEIQEEPITINDQDIEVPYFEEGKLEIKENTKKLDLTIVIKILMIIKWLCIIALGLGLIVFLLGPVFSKDFRNMIKNLKIKSILREYMNKLREFFLYLFKINSKDTKYSTVSSRDFKNFLDDFIKKSAKSKEKKAELDKLTKNFIRLISFGNSINVKYKKNLAPLEYTKLLENYFSEKNPELKKLAYECGFLFEKALYSYELLSKEEQNSFLDAVDRIVLNGKTESGELK